MNYFNSRSLILGAQKVYINEFEGKLALCRTKHYFLLTPHPFLLRLIQSFRASSVSFNLTSSTNFLFFPPPPPPPLLSPHCFQSFSFSLLPLVISKFLMPPPPSLPPSPHHFSSFLLFLFTTTVNFNIFLRKVM